MLSFKLSFSRRPKKSAIYAYTFSCMLREEDCAFCKEMDGICFSPNDPLAPLLISQKEPDKAHPFGYQTPVSQKLCTCEHCGCMWVEILKEETFPPALNVPKSLRNRIEKAAEELR